MTSKAYLQIAIASCTFYSIEFQTITRDIFVLHFKLLAVPHRTANKSNSPTDEVTVSRSDCNPTQLTGTTFCSDTYRKGTSYSYSFLKEAQVTNKDNTSTCPGVKCLALQRAFLTPKTNYTFKTKSFRELFFILLFNLASS